MKKYISIASFSGAIAVMLGALGAHALKKILTQTQLNSFETGVKYQIIHSLLLLVLIIIPTLLDVQKKMIAKILITGIVFFSGSIYLLTFNVVPATYIWFITPLGGVLLILAWILIGYYSLKNKTDL